MERQHLKHLEARVREHMDQLTSLANKKGLEEFLTIIHKPGFTTPAEALLISGIADSMVGHATALLGLRQVLLDGASKVELNPQPLPPKVASS
jgi:hypothetical protein